MAKKKDDKNNTPPATAQSDAPVGSGINAPDLDPKTLEAGLRSIKDGAQAYSVASAIEQANETRNKKNAVIWRKYNGDPPYNQKELIDANEGWRSNAAFGFLAGIVSRVVPAPVQIIDSARYLTSATLHSDEAQAAMKSEKFRTIITRAIRQWDGWKSFNYALAQEDVLMGGAFVAWLDEDDPFPRFFRQDEGFVPDGTLQQAKSAQLFVAKQSWLINEAVDFIKDGKDIAEKAGWDVDAMVETINAAMPNQPTSDSSSGHARAYEDVIREGNVGQSYTTGAKVVQVYHLLAVEADGQVTHYIVDRKNNHKVLFQKDDRYPNMQGQLTLFTLEPGNGKFYSSKGLGRMLVNMHISIERLRNTTIDNIYLAGLPILKSDPNKVASVQVKVMHPFIVTTTDADFTETNIPINVEEFMQLDSKITELAEISAGAYIPDKLTTSGTRDKTATEASIDANREAQAKIAFLARYWGQLGDMVSNIQKKLCNSSSTHEAVKAVLEELTEAGLTEEDIMELSNSPAAEVVQDMTQSQNSQKVAVWEALKGDPKADQGKLYQMGVTAMSSPEVADAVLIPEEFDQTVEAEAMRLQMLENDAMMNGNPMPVSPRDNHPVHLNTIAGQLKQDWPGVKKNAPTHPEQLDAVNLAMVHGKAHIDMWKQSGAKPEDVKPFEDALQALDKDIESTVQGIQQQKAQMAEQQAPAVPPQAGPGAPPPPHPAQVVAQAKISESINYKDAPDDIKRQMEAAAGFTPSKVGAAGNSTATADQTRHVQQTVSAVHSVSAIHAGANAPSAMVRPPQPPPVQGPPPPPPQTPVVEAQGVPVAPPLK